MSADHVESWYAATAKHSPDRPAFQGHARADVVIVGGGYTGLSAALHLARRGYSVAVLEAARVGWGASGRNGGHVGTGQRSDQQTLERLVGQEHARALWELGQEAVDLVCTLIDEEQIDCDLREGNLDVAHSRAAARELRDEVEHLQSAYACDTLSYVDGAELAALTSAAKMFGGALNTAARHLHPLNYCLGLAAAAEASGARIYEDSRVTHYVEGEKIRVRCARGQLDCDFLILGCNGYLGKLEPRLAGQIMPINNYVVATEPLDEDTAKRLIRDDCSMSDTRFVINYWKLSADRRLLFGGGESYSSRFPRDIRGFVRPHMLRIYPELADTSIEYGWGGTLAITLNRMPALGSLSPRIYYAQGYSGHGVPIATLAGKLLSEAVAGTAERFDVMAGVPTPRFPGGTLLRWPALVVGMLYYSLRDRLG